MVKVFLKHRGTENTEKKPAPALFKIPFQSLLCVSVSLCFKKELRTAHPSSTGFGNTEAQRTRRRNPLLLYLNPLSIPTLCLRVSVFQKRAPDRASFQRDIWKHRGTENTEKKPAPALFKIPFDPFSVSLCLCVSYPLIAVDYPSNTIDEFGFVEID